MGPALGRSSALTKKSINEAINKYDRIRQSRPLSYPAFLQNSVEADEENQADMPTQAGRFPVVSHAA